MSLLSWILEGGWTVFERAFFVADRAFTGIQYRSNNTHTRIDNHIRFAERHHRIWGDILSKPETARIIVPTADAALITPLQIRAVNFVLLHTETVFRASKAGQYRAPDREKMEADIKHFLSLPIPGAAWATLKGSYSADFVAFVDKITGKLA
ncbi:hypothetical protein [Oleiharenicola lentus]|uniref:hypothetical protein n=1 Tax=Oleiharenicola lentus TaxID=2508720 RepID=UPI003F6689EF